MTTLFVRLLNDHIEYFEETETAEEAEVPEETETAEEIQAAEVVEKFDADAMECEWVAIDEQEEVVGHGATTFETLHVDVEESLETQSIDQTVLFLSDAMTLFIRAEVPGKTSSQMVKALPYAVENYIATDIEEMHIARGTVRRGLPVDCLTIAKTNLGPIVDRLARSGFEPSYCSTIGMQIPIEEGTIGAIADRSNVWVRTRDQLAVMDMSVATEALKTAAQSSDDMETKVQVKKFSSARSLSRQISSSPFVEIQDISDPLLVHIAQNFDEQVGINLLQGEFSARDNQALNARAWMRNGAIAVASLLVYIAALYGQGIWAGLNSTDLEDEAKKLYESIYGQSPGIRDPVTRMRGNLGAASRQTGTFETLLGEFARVVDSTQSRTVIDSLIYRDSQQSLATVMELSSLTALDGFEKALERGPVDVEVENIEQVGFGVRVNLTLTMKQ